jgi:hypothetical protein
MKGVAPLVMAAALSVTVAGDLAANGREVQREMLGRVVSVDAREGTLVVERELRGKVWRLAFRIAPATTVFACSAPAATPAALRARDAVSVYYEPVGREGLANLVIVEPSQ